MKHLLSYLLLVICMFNTSCQRESGTEELPVNLPPGETPDGARLSRIVFRYSDRDSAYTDLQYDAVGRWIGNRTNADDPVLNDYTRTRASRNPAGIIYRYVTFAKDAANRGDSSVYRVLYNGERRRYTAKIRVHNETGAPMDSTFYVYDASNRIQQARLFMQAAPNLPYQELARAEFSYDGSGDLVSLRSLVVDPQLGPGFVPTSLSTFAFDDKVNPLNLGMEALVLDQIFFISPNNIIRIVTKDLRHANAPEDTVAFQYAYHPSNRPRSGQLRGGALPVPMYFRYR